MSLRRAYAPFLLIAMLASSAAMAEERQGAGALPLAGATFGMSVADWKALPPPASAGPTAVRTCWNDTASVKVPGYSLSAEDRRTDLTTCAYLSRFGTSVLPHSVEFDPLFRAYNVRFLFYRGQLSELEFRVSIDGYSDVMSLLTRRFGPPAQTLRETAGWNHRQLTGVRQIWRKGATKVELDDPSPNPTELAVTVSLPPASRT